MDTTDFSTLIGRLELEADKRPPLYHLKVKLVAALGYLPVALAAAGVLVSLIALLIPLLTGGQPGFFAAIALLATTIFLLALIRSLWVRIELPAGRYLASEEAPALFAAIDEVIRKSRERQRGKQPEIGIDSVILNREFTLAMWQVPARGVFGGFSNHLEIGIPLLAALSAAEFKTVLAHEIAHLGGTHDAFNAWIYRQRRTWLEVEQKLAQPTSLVDRIAGFFYGWYAAYFNAYTFVLARNHEYAADRAAARATNAHVLGRALIKIELLGRFLAEVFWKRFFDQIEAHPEPRYLPYAMLPRAFGLAQKEWSRQDWLSQSLRAYGSTEDTHPGLGERLTALEVTPELPTQVPDKSALALLGESGALMLQWCDQEWSAEYLPAWKKRHEAIREMRWKIAQYENTPAAHLKLEDLWEKSTLLLEIGQEPDAVETLQLLVSRGEKFGKAHLLLGRLLLESGNEHGLKNLLSAAQQDPELAEEAGSLGYGYLMDRGRKGEAHRFYERIGA